MIKERSRRRMKKNRKQKKKSEIRGRKRSSGLDRKREWRINGSTSLERPDTM
jgi:hypothetical protein